ncbi:hypothetical protein ACQPYK_49205 (plasmid) [Streptosporangium sp. CA-135522]|uniref:hypothetical protein n=1 Tax=Streptosporangium sp. CA-135522 TaxID=3240072 RepID=UPI003D902823
MDPTRVIPREERQLAVLAQTYPGWHIDQDTPGEWRAVRRAPVSREEADAGVERVSIPTSPEALGSALAVQAERTHSSRARRTFAP